MDMVFYVHKGLNVVAWLYFCAKQRKLWKFLNFKRNLIWVPKKGRTMMIWKKRANAYEYTLWAKNSAEIYVSHTVAEINAFLHFT